MTPEILGMDPGQFILACGIGFFIGYCIAAVVKFLKGR